MTVLLQTPDERLLEATGFGGNIEGVTQALRDGANPNARQPGTWDGTVISSLWGVAGHTALRQAIECTARLADANPADRTVVVRLLLDAGADPNLHCNEETLLTTAAGYGDGSLVALLLERGAGKSVLERDIHKGRTALETAIEAQQWHVGGGNVDLIDDAEQAVALLREATRQAIAEQQAVLHAAAGEVSVEHRSTRRRL